MNKEVGETMKPLVIKNGIGSGGQVKVGECKHKCPCNDCIGGTYCFMCKDFNRFKKTNPTPSLLNKLEKIEQLDTNLDWEADDVGIKVNDLISNQNILIEEIKRLNILIKK